MSEQVGNVLALDDIQNPESLARGMEQDEDGHTWLELRAGEKLDADGRSGFVSIARKRRVDRSEAG
jgi:hypothetical protein